LSRSRFWILVAVAVAEAAGASAIILTSHREAHKVATVVLAVTAGLLWAIGGLYVYRRRPDNRTGLYLAAVGYLWMFASLADVNENTLWTVGIFLSNLAFVPFAALVLAYPSGHLTHRVDRVIVRATAAFVLIGPPLLLLFADHPPSCGHDCGKSAIVVYRSPGLEHTIDIAGSLFTVGLIAVVVGVLVGRWRRASVALRRVLTPVYLTCAIALLFLLLSNLFSSISARVADAMTPFFFVAFGAVPFAFGYGILRSRFARASVADLVIEIGRGGSLRDAIASALGDPSVELAFCVEHGSRLVDRDGRPFELPAEGSGRASLLVEHDGRRVGAIVHDESLHEEPALVESVAATVALALDNERLEAELRSQYAFLMTIVDTAPSLLLSVDTTGRIRNCNPATVAASGFADEKDVRDRYFWDVFIDPTEREAMIWRFNEAAPEFPPSEYENIFTNARGEWRVIAWRSAPVHDQTGNVVRIVAGGLDVTERKLQEEELRASRMRLVAAGDEERRRLERNLHDGAQQRLVSLSVALRLAQGKLDTDPAGARELLGTAGEELAHALEELRELARGIHPAVLTNRGLDAALHTLAERTPIPVDVSTEEGRLPAPIEAAAYYVVSEAVANVVKHAAASSVGVRVTVPNGHVVVEVADDGVGGADMRTGSGLRGLADRVAALDGELRVESPAGGGTRVVAEIPLR
jgi:PAS domain S-box-containing protein